MSTQTTNYGLTKPETSDFYDVNVTNENLDIIDRVMNDHISSKSNPHGVTKSNVGLGNVPNVSTNDQTPTYTVASANTNLTSGEKLSTAFAKIAKAVSSLISHLADSVGHITSAERTKWNAKLDASEYTTQIVGGTETVDFNNLLDTKKYAFSSGSITMATNTPEASNGILQVLRGGGYVHQVYTTNGDITYIRSYNGSTWSAWKKIAKYNDVLPLTGGIVKGSNVTNLQLENTSSETSCVGFKGSTGHLGYIGMKGSNPVYITTGNVVNNIIHSGISAPVVISETAPSDTTALWVW